MGKVKKLFGENPETIMVLETPVEFDAEGVADVEDEEVLAVLDEVGGYEVLTEDASEAEAKAKEEAEAKAKEEAEAKAKEEAEAKAKEEAEAKAKEEAEAKAKEEAKVSEETAPTTKATPKRNVPKAN